MEVFIDGWKSHICFSSAHIIPNCGKCSRLHGHTYAVHARVRGEAGDNGILMDFTLIKDSLRSIADELDHHILIPQHMVSRQHPQEIVIVQGGKKYQFPKEDCRILPIASSTAENLAQYILDKVFETLCFPAHIHYVALGVDEGVGQGAWTHRTLK